MTRITKVSRMICSWASGRLPLPREKKSRFTTLPLFSFSLPLFLWDGWTGLSD